tara:strand:- start:1144 stop:1533 length:390 start_codon:yes stop_codon:yes gene_type:complete
MDKVSNDFVNQLLESRGWDKAGIRVDEGKKSDGAKKVGKSAYDNPANDPKGIVEAEVEGNSCPLCEADFGEYELTDEALQEHAATMMETFTEAGLISEEMEIGEEFIIENASEILDILSEAGLIVESDE